MNNAEQALRRCTYGYPRIAIAILNSWTPDQREEFRKAYYEHDWAAVYKLCAIGGYETALNNNVLNHLLDATAPGQNQFPA